MRERQVLKVTRYIIRVNSSVEALMNIICELKITSGSKINVEKFYGDPTFD